jgi:hypothetical protein
MLENKRMLTQLNTWLCLDIRIKEEITIKKLVEKGGRDQINEEIKSKLRSGNANGVLRRMFGLKRV